MKPCVVSTTPIIFIMTLFTTRIWSLSAAAFVVTPSHHWRRRIPAAVSSVRSTSTSESNHAAGEVEEKGEKGSREAIYMKVKAHEDSRGWEVSERGCGVPSCWPTWEDFCLRPRTL